MYLAKEGRIVSNKYLEELAKKAEGSNKIYAVVKDNVIYTETKSYKDIKEMKKDIKQFKANGFKVYYHEVKTNAEEEKSTDGSEARSS